MQMLDRKTHPSPAQTDYWYPDKLFAVFFQKEFVRGAYTPQEGGTRIKKITSRSQRMRWWRNQGIALASHYEIQWSLNEF